MSTSPENMCEASAKHESYLPYFVYLQGEAKGRENLHTQIKFNEAKERFNRQMNGEQSLVVQFVYFCQNSSRIGLC